MKYQVTLTNDGRPVIKNLSHESFKKHKASGHIMYDKKTDTFFSLMPKTTFHRKRKCRS